MSNASHRGPRPLSEILGDLFTARGYGRLLARRELEAAWSAAVGEDGSRQTHLGEVRRGVLNVTVAHSTLLEEMAAFRKPALLDALRRGAPATTIHDIRFRLGLIPRDFETCRGQSLGSQNSGPAGPASTHSENVPPEAAMRAEGRRSSRRSRKNRIEP